MKAEVRIGHRHSSRVKASKATAIVGVDQAISSATNFGALAIIARAADAATFGVVALAALVFTTCITLGRAFVGEPLLVGRIAGRQAVSSSWAVGAILGVAVVSIGTVIDDFTVWAIVGASLPGAIAHDSYRLSAIREGTPAKALVADLAWLAVVAASALSTIVGIPVGPAVLLGFWVGGASLVVLVLDGRSLFRLYGPDSGLDSLRESRALSWSAVRQFGTSGGVLLANVALLTWIVDATAAGAFRGAFLLYGPCIVLLTVVTFVVMPRVADLDHPTNLKSIRQGALVSLAATSLCGIWAILVGLAPDAFGIVILGDTWAGAESVRWHVGAIFLSLALSAGPASILRGASRTDTVANTQTALLPIAIGLPVLGAVAGGVRGFSILMAVANLIVAAALFYRLLRITGVRAQSGIESAF